MKTMRDVAERANVSATTVSRVLSGRQPRNGDISEETRQRVLLVAKELGYRRNALVQAVVSGQNPTLGFLASGIHLEFNARMLAGALEETAAAGYALQILQVKHPSLKHLPVERCLEMRLAGIITLALEPSALDHLIQEVRPFNIPVAYLDTSYRRDWGVRVVSDDNAGCRLAIQHLADLGHRHIGFIGGAAGWGMADIRENAYRNAMAEMGLEVRPGYILSGRWRPAVAETMAMEMLQLPERPTAIFCANDSMSLATQRAARKLGMQLPRDLSVVGFANLTLSDLGDPPLTTVAQPFEDIGRTAARLLLERLKQDPAAEDSNKPVEVLLPTHLVTRQSTAPPPFQVE